MFPTYPNLPLTQNHHFSWGLASGDTFGVTKLHQNSLPYFWLLHHGPKKSTFAPNPKPSFFMGFGKWWHLWGYQVASKQPCIFLLVTSWAQNKTHLHQTQTHHVPCGLVSGDTLGVTKLHQNNLPYFCLLHHGPQKNQSQTTCSMKLVSGGTFGFTKLHQHRTFEGVTKMASHRKHVTILPKMNIIHTNQHHTPSDPRLVVLGCWTNHLIQTAFDRPMVPQLTRFTGVGYRWHIFNLYII